MKYEKLTVFGLSPMTYLFRNYRILKGFIKPVSCSQKTSPKHPEASQVNTSKKQIALDIENCIAMSDVFNRRWAMLPRSDRLIGELENKSGTKKGKCRTTDPIFVAHFYTFRSSCIERTATS